MLSGRRFALRALLGGTAALALSAPRAWARQETYTYDALGRLTSVTYDNGDVIHYVYDAAGNRTQVQRNGSPPSPPTPPGPPAPSTLAVGLTATSWYDGPPSGEDGPVAALPSGGVPPYTYLWQKVSGNPATFADSPSSNMTSWVFTGSPTFPYLKVSTWRCKVTDAASAIAYSSNVMVTFDVS